MKVTQAKCIIKFRRILDTSEYFSGIQEITKNDFEDLTILNYGPDAPAHIPRIKTKSNFRHANLFISLNQIVLEIFFDSEYNENFSKIITYLKTKSKHLIDIVKLFGTPINFSGMTIFVLEDNPKLYNQFENMYNKPAKQLSVNSPYEFSHKFAYIKNDYHYLNLNVYNPIKNENNIQKVSDIQHAKFNRALVFELDVNDKHGYNYLKNYESSIDMLDKNIELIEDILHNKIKDIINCERTEL